MATARDLINGSLRLLGVISSADSASAAEHVDALSALNGMLDSWSAENRMLYIDTRESFTLIPSQSTYTMGPTPSDFITTRPTDVISARIYDPTTNARTYIEIINTKQWDEQQVKNILAPLPTKLFAEYGPTSATLYLWPVPNQAKTLELTTRKPITSIATVNDTVNLPPGYMRALRYNLAIELAPEYGKAISSEIAMIAEEAKQNVKQANTEDIYMTCDAGVLSNAGFKILTGE